MISTGPGVKLWQFGKCAVWGHLRKTNSAVWQTPGHRGSLSALHWDSGTPRRSGPKSFSQPFFFLFLPEDCTSYTWIITKGTQLLLLFLKPFLWACTRQQTFPFATTPPLTVPWFPVVSVDILGAIDLPVSICIQCSTRRRHTHYVPCCLCCGRNR